MKQLQSELPGWTGLRAVARVLWPPLTFIGGAVLGAESLGAGIVEALNDSEVTAGTVVLAIASIALLFGWIGIFARDAFAYKRRLMGVGEEPSYSLRDYLSKPASNAEATDALLADAPNVYEAEDNIWKALGRRKRKEPLVDLWLDVLSVSTLPAYMALWLDPGDFGLATIVIAVASFLLLADALIAVILARRKREWR
jgi:hypothetical protein